MGGKTATTTQSVAIPPEVLARYNAVNARAETAAQQPFQRYTGQFVAPLTGTQQAGIGATNYAAGMAQPYYQDATQQLLAAQRAAMPIYGQAYGDIGAAQQQGQATTQQALRSLSGGQSSSAPLMSQSASLTGRGLTSAQPYIDAAGNYLTGGTRDVNVDQLGGADIERYMSPYMKNVIDAQQALQAQESASQRAALQSQQVGAGAFGGERSGLSQANLARQQSMANQAVLSNLLQSGYGQALGVAQQQQAQQLAAEQANRAAQQFGTQAAAALGQQAFGQNLAAAQQYGNLGQALFGQGAQQAQLMGALGQQQYGMGLGAAQAQAGIGQNIYGMGAQTAQSLAGLGAGAQQAALQGAQAQIGAGTLEQQTQQAQAAAEYQQFLQERGYDFQMAQFLANIAMGTGALSGSTTTTTQPAGFFSDERLKSDIEPVGELFDGQKIYRYEMGDGRKQIGLIAQEVEGRTPEAVGESQGYKTVDYGRATDEAAGLGAVASMGGAVMEPGAYAGGGLVGGDDLRAILASQNQSFGGFGGPMYGGASQGTPFGKAGGIVPEAKLPVAKLVTAGNAPAQRQSGLSEAANTGAKIAELGKMGKTALLGSAPTADDKKGGAGLIGSGGSMSSEDNLFTRGKDFLSSSFGFAYGGLVPREGYALQGSVNPYETENDPIGDVLETQEEQKAPEMMKPGQMPGAPKSGLSDVKDIASIGSSIASLAAFLPFSDARLKDNIEPVGKTFDGQNIYRYDMGDGRTQLGLMAQEVLERKPEAVGERNGFLTLDYDRATEDATPFAYGGLVPRSGYAEGGGPEFDADKLMAHLASQSKAANQIALKHKMDDSTELRGGGVSAGPFTGYSGGLGFDLGGGRLDLDANYGRAPNSPPQYGGRIGFSKKFAEGGLVPRKGYATEGGVPGEEDLPAVGAQEAAMPVGDKNQMVKDIIRREAEAQGVPYSVALQVAQNESGLNPKAQAKTSSAGGLYGTIDDTFKSMGGTGSKYDPEQNARAGIKYISNNLKALGSEGDSEGSLAGKAYLGHFFGTGGAKSVLSNPNAPISETLPNYAAAVKSNPQIANWTGADAQKWAEAKMSGAKFEAPPRPPGLVPQGGVEGRPSTKGTYGGASAREAGVGDVAREFLPEGTLTSEKFWVPALSFIGSALASKNPTLGGALGEGIVGGVAGYQSQQKQQAELAKGVLDIVKDRFVIRTNPDTLETQYFNKSTGQRLTPEQFNAAVTKMATGLGVSPAALGLEPAAGTQAPKAIGAIGAEAALPKPAAEAAEGAKPAVAGEPAKPGEPAPVVNKYDMSLGELKNYAEQNPKDFSLIGERDPAKQRAEIKKYEKAMNAAQEQGNEAEAGRYFNLAKQSREILDKNINDAVELQYKTNQEIKKAGTQRADEYLKTALKRADKYGTVRESLVRLADVYSGFKPGRETAIKAEIQEWANAVGVRLPESFNAAAYDEAMKIALTQAFGLVGENDLTRAPKASVEFSAQTVPTPKMASGAAFALIGKTLGEMDYYHDRDRAYLDQGRGMPPEEFIFKYQDKNKGKLHDSIKKAYSEIPISRGMTDPQIDSLKATYKFTPRLAGEASPTEQRAAPEAPAIPAPDQRETNRVYDIPGKGQYRWMGTGWQKVTQ